MYYKSKSNKSKGRKLVQKLSYKSKYSPYKRFTNAIHAEETERTYVYHLNKFLESSGLKTYERLLQLAKNKDVDLDQIFAVCQNYVQYLVKEKKLAPRTINTAVASMKLFFESNGVMLPFWKQLSKQKGKIKPVYLDRIYTKEEIQDLLEHADIREKVAILTLLSTGMRVGALAKLKYGDIEYLPEYKLYKFIADNDDPIEHYTTFCTPECAETINVYFKHREEKEGETITKNSPFITHKITSTRRFKDKGFLSSQALQKILERQRYDANIMSVTKMGTIEKSKKQFGKIRKEVMRAHGFRKYFNSKCNKVGMNYVMKEKLMGHKTGQGLDIHYDRNLEDVLLGEYLKVIPLLTIGEENRLQLENIQLHKEVEDINILKQQVNQLIKENKEKDKELDALWEQQMYNEVSEQIYDIKLREAQGLPRLKTPPPPEIHTTITPKNRKLTTKEKNLVRTRLKFMKIKK